MPKLAAIDLGAKKIGLAVTDSGGLMVFGRGVITDSRPTVLKEKLLDFLLKEKPELVVYGLPYNLNGDITPQCQKIIDYSKEIQDLSHSKSLQYGVEYIDESFSTHQAQNKISELGLQKHVKQDDEMSAMILLERFLARK